MANKEIKLKTSGKLPETAIPRQRIREVVSFVYKSMGLSPTPTPVPAHKPQKARKKP